MECVVRTAMGAVRGAHIASMVLVAAGVLIRSVRSSNHFDVRGLLWDQKLLPVNESAQAVAGCTQLAQRGYSEPGYYRRLVLSLCALCSTY